VRCFSISKRVSEGADEPEDREIISKQEGLRGELLVIVVEGHGKSNGRGAWRGQ
jgi:hypothetical protein